MPGLSAGFRFGGSVIHNSDVAPSTPFWEEGGTMSTLSEGARRLPLRHISIRVPWNDTGWTGCFCRQPKENASCLILPRVRETRDDELEASLAGKPWDEVDQGKLPPCVSERGSFMSKKDLTRKLSHPYSETSEAHKHMLPTPFRLPSYSAACLPFAWMLTDSAREKAESLELGFKPELEEKAHETMGFKTGWVQTKHNQLVMLDTFFSAIEPQKSLCFFYAKRIPFVEENRRVIIGVGWVEHVGEPVEYKYSSKGKLDSILWERAVQHSVRPNFKEGFLLPYHEVLEHLKENPSKDPADFVACAPDEHFWSFSYASEHVTNDGAIAALLSCNKALQHIQKAVDGPWVKVQQWIDNRLNELWKMRGPYPGLGAALHAFGIPNANLLAFEVEKLNLKDAGDDPWVFIDNLLRKKSKAQKELSRLLSPTMCRKWESLPSERRNLLKLLSRFELTNDQAACYYVSEDKRRRDFRIQITDTQAIENPYMLFEADRLTDDPIALPTVDRGLFPDQILRDKFPLPEPSRIEDHLDERRVRAFAIGQLERAASSGHTLLSRVDVIRQVRELEVQPPCPVDDDMMVLAEKMFSPEIVKIDMKDGKVAYQLKRLHEAGGIIRDAVLKRLKGKRHQADINWRPRLDEELKGKAAANDAQEHTARDEKTAALKELFSSRISVLVGPAGTGKTTLLKVLCNEKSVKSSGVLALAPTGKARVQLEKNAGLSGAKTIAQFLMRLDRYEPRTGTYRLSDRSPESSGKTVIIDEASMLTEEQLAAVMNALAGVERLILVGDPRQLPPIGAGRPFLDIVEKIQPSGIESKFPRVGPGYADLTVRRRQVGKSREDLLLADWFSGRPVDPGADEIWTKIIEGNVPGNLRFVSWKSSEELQAKLLKTMVEELKLNDENDISGFEITLGGSLYNGNIYFHCGRDKEAGACKRIEDWQILSPTRNQPHGVEALNRFIQNKFRHETKEQARKKWRKIPKPLGREEIVYGDKVINLTNHVHKNVYPEEGALAYLANGEIGVVVGQFKGRNASYKGLPWQIEVEFASQPCFKYGFGARDFAEEAEPKLELAYALTIHKVQGSEFGLTLLIIPNPCWLLSRELLYTALTRQQNRVVVFHQGEPHELKHFASDYHSEAAQRLTNLFETASPVVLKGRFLEERLIHSTRRGESVRSKSEVIIADLLYSQKIEYLYEAPLVGKDGATRYPDFTFEDAAMGLRVYWEHLGLMHVPEYLERWERKLKWYKEQGILPHEHGGGQEGILVVTKDDERGGIQSNEIEKLLKSVLRN